MAEVISKRSIVYDITFDASGAKKGAKEVDKAVKDVGKTANGLDELMKGVGKGIVAAFAVEKILAFAKQASELADKAQSVKTAFDRLDGVSLQKLRQATGGAVNDIILMQKAVQAANFKIPLQELEKLFRFATIRAKETGESVEVLVDSIVEGLGGGSARAFKALGISSDEFQRKVKQTGNTTKAVTQLIDESFKRTGDSLDGLVDAGDKLETSMTNFQIVLGGLINEGFLDDFKDFLADAITLTTDLITGQDSFNQELQKTRNLVQLTEEDVVNMFSAQLAAQEIGFKSYTAGAALTQEDQQKIIDGYKAQAQAIINSTKVVEQETKKQGDAVRENQENIIFDPLLFFKQRQALLDGLQQIANDIAEKNEGNDFKIRPTIDNSELEAYGRQLLEQGVQTATFSEVLRDNADTLVESTERSLEALMQLSKDGSNAQIAFAGVAIFANQAKALSAAIAAATEAAASTGGLSLPILIPSFISIALSTFAQVNSLLGQAKAAQSNVEAFAEGEIDLHRSGETRGRDSIPAILMPGESVITTKRTREYKPFLEAIHSGNLDELIRVNYVEPALVMQSLNGSKIDSTEMPDYTDKFYRQWLATGEGNVTGKRMVGLLSGIRKDLRSKSKRYH